MTARIVVVSPDPAFTQPLVTGPLAAVAAIEVHRTLDALDLGEPPAMCVIHAGGALARSPGGLGSRLPDAPVIAVLPGADLATAIEVMQSADRVAGVMTADPPDLRQLAVLATRIVSDDVLGGLEPVLAPGTEVHARLVADHPDKSRCLSEIAEFAERCGIPRARRVSIEQCVDEMVMNALYDAPVDARGRPLFAGIPTRTRIALRTEHSALVRYACDGQQLAISVRDAFGRLDRPTVLRHLHKCLHAGQPIDRKVGGAGLGLYLMVNAASAVAFHVVPGVATEVLCVFDVEAPRLRLAQLGFVAQRDARGQPATGGARRLPAGSRWRRVRVLALAGAAVAAALGIAAWSLGPGQRDAPVATLELDSQPPGATAVVDGKAMGPTPLTLTTLAPGASVAIAFQRTGYRPATAHVQVPAAGQRTRLVQPLEVADDFVRVRFVSRPPGAEIRRTGQPAAIDRSYTPAELLVEADQVQRFTLVMPGHVPLVIPPFTPGRGTQVLEKSGDLVAGATLHIAATLDGKVTIAGAPHCAELALPADCTLAPGSYELTYLGPDHAVFTRHVTMGDQAATEKLEIGVVEAAPGKQLGPSGAHRIVLEAGTHAVMVSDPAGAHRAIVQVQPGATVIAP